MVPIDQIRFRDIDSPPPEPSTRADHSNNDELANKIADHVVRGNFTLS